MLLTYRKPKLLKEIPSGFSSAVNREKTTGFISLSLAALHVGQYRIGVCQAMDTGKRQRLCPCFQGKIINQKDNEKRRAVFVQMTELMALFSDK